MTTPTRDELALYAMGHHDGDAAELERRLADDPEVAAQLADEAGFALLLRAAASEATFCSTCHDLVDGERCAACGVARLVPASGVRPPARSTRRVTWSIALAAVTLAAAVAILLVSRSWREASPTPSETTAAPSQVPRPPAEDRRPVGTLPPPAPIVQTPPAPIVQTPPAKTPRSALVKLHVVTRPRGVAVVLGGQYRGLTPLVVSVPRSAAPVTLSLQHVGYQELVKQLALRDDTRVDVSLTPTGAPPVHEGRFKDEECMACHRPRS